MLGTSSRQFGLIIAYVLPGFIALGGLAPLLPTVAQWLRPVATGGYDLGIGPPLYAVLGATALGLILSCFRWIVVDQLHAVTGLNRPAWDDGQLDRVLNGFDYLVQNHFRYYEFCGNTLLAVLLGYLVNRIAGSFAFFSMWTDAGIAVVIAVLFLASRSALSNYYVRTTRLIGRQDTGDTMYNGNDHGGHGGQPHPQAPAKPTADPKAPAQPPKEADRGVGPEKGK
jgi:hypothetical protein